VTDIELDRGMPPLSNAGRAINQALLELVVNAAEAIVRKRARAVRGCHSNRDERFRTASL